MSASNPTTTDETQKWTAPPNGSPCWIAIPASDIKACKKFYSSVFPTWDFKPATAEYGEEHIAMWTYAGPNGLSGGIVNAPAGCKKTGEGMKEGLGVTIYHWVESIDEVQKRIEELGGKASGEKQEEHGNGWFMHFLDPEGNRFGIYEVKKKE